MKQIAVKLIIFILCIALLVGCQATPEQPVVVQKDFEQMIEKGMEQSSSATPMPDTGLSYAELCAHYGVPKRFQTTITEGELTINCDVEIELPNVTVLPMARVEAGRFSQDRVYALWGALCGDTQMYITPEVMSKAYYEQEIIKIRAQLASETNEDIIDTLESVIDMLEDNYEKAPESIDLVPADGTLQTQEVKHEKTDAASGSMTMLYATSDVNSKDGGMRFNVANDIDYTDTSVYSFEDEQGNLHVIAPRSGSHIEFSRDGSTTNDGAYDRGTTLADVTALSLSGGEVENCLLSTTPKRAREIVEQLLSQAQMDDMMIDTVALYSSKRDWGGDPCAPEDTEPEKHAYIFRLLRQINGVKTESTHDSSETSMDEMAYGKEWWYERLTIVVDDDGIANLSWMGPLEVTEVLTNDAAIRPWSDIAQVFEKMIVVKSEIYTDHELKNTIDVTHASLSLQRIMERDSFTTGLLVPVWNFYGTVTSVYGDEAPCTTEREYYPLISINAIDGSVIDVGKGY